MIGSEAFVNMRARCGAVAALSQGADYNTGNFSSPGVDVHIDSELWPHSAPCAHPFSTSALVHSRAPTASQMSPASDQEASETHPAPTSRCFNWWVSAKKEPTADAAHTAVSTSVQKALFGEVAKPAEPRRAGELIAA